MTGHHIPEKYLEGYARMLAEVAATGRRPTRPELDVRRAFGEQAAEDGHSLRSLVAAHLAATRAAWPAGTSGSAGPAHSVLTAVELAVDAFAEGYERAQRLAVRQEEAVRREFIDDLLYGGSDLGRLAERAERFGLRLSRTHAVAVAESGHAYDEGTTAIRSVELALFSRFGDRSILLTTKDGRLICVAPGDQDAVLTHFAKHAYAAGDGDGDVKVAIGRSHPGSGGIVHSYEEALNALELGARMSLEGPVLRAADLLVYPVLTRDREALVDLVRSALGPLRHARGGAQPLVSTLSHYFEAGCVAAEAARRMSLSVRALTYRLERIHQLTGANPAEPAHRYTLQTAVIGARLLNWPDQEI
ncbi:PucR family transcriptional regulator [Streptomyces sp. NPDC090053]|uniref:PucR family transcriptional regulator n=1 Tax=Streptomyces sp. NPDC090053 TaxID=3365932 RepID=UPI00380F9BF9